MMHFFTGFALAGIYFASFLAFAAHRAFCAREILRANFFRSSGVVFAHLALTALRLLSLRCSGVNFARAPGRLCWQILLRSLFPFWA